jgi:multidrug resistance efflux pump
MFSRWWTPARFASFLFVNGKKILVVAAVIGLAAWLLTGRGRSAHAVSGTIEADEVRVATRAGGRVTQLFAREGDALTNGQLIAELQADDIKARREYAAALLAELEAGPRPQEISAAKAERDAFQADVDFALADAKRKVELYDAKTISITDRDEAVSRAAALKGRAAAAEERYAELAAGTRPEKIAQARAQLAEADAQLAEMQIKAPADTTLETLLVKLGDVVPPNGAVATLLFQNDRWLRVYVPEPWLPKIKPGEAVTLRVDGFPKQTFNGVVEQINRKAEFTPRNVQTPEERVKQVFGVKITVVDDGGALRAGMTADVNFPGLP